MFHIPYVICSVGIVLPTIEVRFEHLKADAEVHVGSRPPGACQPFWTRSLTFLRCNIYLPLCTEHTTLEFQQYWPWTSNFFKFQTFGTFLFIDQGAGNALRILPSRKQTMPILSGISGIIKPQRYRFIFSGLWTSASSVHCIHLALVLVQDDSAARPTRVREDHTAACFGWEAWQWS